MTEEMVALARRAVACKAWRWMPGMRWWTDDDRGRLDDFQPEYMGRPTHALPDLTDPATLGCLLALVREAWGEDTWVQHEDEWTCWVVLNGQLDHHVGATEAEALVAALEAAP